MLKKYSQRVSIIQICTRRYEELYKKLTVILSHRFSHSPVYL
jgi:hypothetical protein